jgi:hypothetical protein
METVDLMPAIKEGSWFYGGLTICPVRIVKHHTLFGTNDPSDPPEISFDKKTDCYYVRYHPPGSHESWHDGGSALSLREAVFLAHSKLGPVVHWTDY